MKRGTPRHPKMKKLARGLGIPLAYAVGIMEMLWHFAGEFTPQGDIGRVDDEEIAEAVAWSKKPAALIKALTDEHWLDADDKHRLIVHDWPDHADESVRKKLVRSGQWFLESYGPRGQFPDGVSPSSGQGSDGGGKSLPRGRQWQRQGKARQETAAKFLGDWPLTVGKVREQFAATDDVMIQEIVEACVANHASLEDSDLCEAIMEARTTNQRSAALYLKTVPEVVKTWAAQAKAGIS